MKSAIYETYVVLWFSRDLWSIGGEVGSVYTGVVVFHRSMINWSREWGLSALVSVHMSICET